MRLRDASAAELADDLEMLRYHRHDTAGLSHLDEETMAFGELSDDLGAAHRTFVQARVRHMDSGKRTGAYSDEAWNVAVTAAQRLADELRKLGDRRIARCTANAGWGECGSPLNDDDSCRYPHVHV